MKLKLVVYLVLGGVLNERCCNAMHCSVVVAVVMSVCTVAVPSISISSSVGDDGEPNRRAARGARESICKGPTYWYRPAGVRRFCSL